MKEFIQHRGCLESGRWGKEAKKGMSASLKIPAALNIFKRSSRLHRGESKGPKSTLHFKVTEEPHKYTRYSTRKLGLFYINKLSIHFANNKSSNIFECSQEGGIKA